MTSDLSERLLSLAFESADESMGLIRVGADGRFFVERYNTSAERFLARAVPEISTEDLTASDLESLLKEKSGLAPERLDAALAPYREAVRTGKPVGFDTELHGLGGEAVPRRVAVTPMCDPVGRVTHLFYRSTDLGEQRRAEERFEALFRVVPASMSISSARDGRFLEVNDAWLALRGLRREQTIGRTARELGHWVDPEDRERLVAELAAGGAVRNRLVRLRMPSGEVRDALYSAERIHWGGEDAVLTTTQDVTELERARREAHEMSERFVRLFEILPIPLSIVRSRDSMRLQANAAWLAFHGWRREEAVGVKATEASVWADPAELQRMIADLRRDGRVRNRLARLRRRDGKVVDTLITVESITWMSEPCSIGATLDVSALEDARREALAARERMQAILENAPDAITITSLEDGRYRYVNPAFTRVFGLAREDALGHGVEHLGFWTSAEERRRALAPLLERGERIQIEHRFVRPDGKPVQILFSALPIDYEGERCILAMVQDVTELAQARREAQAGRERMREVLEAAPVAISIATLEGGAHRYVNPAWSRILGVPQAEAIGRSAAQIGIWSSDAERRAALRPLAERGAQVQFERAFGRADGSTVHMVVTVRPFDYGGEPCVLAISQDVTELEATRRAAHSSSEGFAKLFNLSPMPTAIGRRADGVHLAINDAFCDVLGYGRDEALGRSSLELGIWLDPADRAAIVEHLRRGEMVRQYPARLRHKSGQVLDVLFSAAAIDWQGEPAVLFMPFDVTRLQAARREAEMQHRRFESLFRVSPNPIFVSTLGEGRYLAANDAAARVTGFAPAELVGRSGVELGLWVNPRDRDALAAPLREGRSVHDLGVRFRRRSGEVRHGTISAELIDWHGEQALISSLHDVTDMNRAAEEIRRLNDSLEQKVHERTAALETALREIESFSYTVSHDLRAPLRHLSGFAGLLRERDSVRADPEAMDFATRLGAAAKRLGDMVDSLLEYSRLGRKQISTAEVDLNVEVKLIVAELSAQLDGRAVRWSVEPLPTVRGDPTLLRLLLQNLIDNALKYSRARQEALIAVGARPADREWIVQVKDNGVGFDMRYVDKLFGVFQRLHTEREFEGAGIGLAHAARIVERHGGRIWCDAALDEGATFYFSLPR